MLTGNNSNKRHNVKEWPKRAAALVIVAAMTIACFAVNVLAVDLTQPNSVTVTIPDSYLKDDAALKEADLLVDVYLVAESKTVDGYDTYTLTTTESYAALQDKIDEAQKGGENNQDLWDSLAQEAAQLVKAGKGGTPAASGAAGTALKDIDAGLYLVLVHGKDTPHFFDDTKKDRLWTMSSTDKYEYHFIPQLLALPYKEVDSETGTFNTADDGEWLNDITIEPKIERIDKTVPETTTTPPTTTPSPQPKTGDNNNLVTNMIALIVSAAAILALVIVYAVKRKRNGNAG